MSGGSLRLSRRGLLAGAGAAVGVLASQRLPLAWAATEGAAGLFTLGVASGDPLPDGVVLWTRLAPDPLHGGGMPQRTVPVEWELAVDEGFGRVLRRGVEQAQPEFGHSVHVEVDGLEPAAWYWYRFRAQGEESRVGRTRTAPAPDSSPERLRFAFASCQSYPSGFYAAYRAMARDDLDLVIHLGDYIYEGAPDPASLRPHEGDGEPLTLVDYRDRHAQYKTDPDLQDAHAAFPFAVTWDDHEVDNNWADEIPQDPAEQSPAQFRRRRIAAFQAYYEHMPLRRASLPQGLDLRLYRRFAFGDLAAFSVLDGRQYRSDQPCGDGFPGEPDCPERQDPSLTMLGDEQERWLREGLAGSGSRWNVIANQDIMAQYDYDLSDGRAFNTDQWDGYPVMRQRLLDLLATGQVPNPVVITGDWHSSWVNELRIDFDDPGSPIVGTEFAGTSISSACPWAGDVEAALGANPHVRFFDGDRRGYVRCELTRELWRTDFRLLPASTIPDVTVSDPNLESERTVTWVIPSGGTVQPG
ncbi:MAG: alkaline phosphatase D family protein [Egibacteraceae bacterium]